MSQVSLFVLAGLDRGLRAEGMRIDPFLEGTDIAPDRLHRLRPGRCSWEAFVGVLDRLADDLGGEAALRAFCRDMMRTTPPGLIKMLARRYLHPHTLFYVGGLWYGPSLFQGATATVDTEQDFVVQRITLPPSWQITPAVCALFVGSLEGGPTLMDWPPAKVELSRSAQRLTLRIQLVATEEASVEPAELALEQEAAQADLVELTAFQPASVGGMMASSAGDRGAQSTTAGQVRWWLEQGADGMNMRASDAARALGMSERTLGRALAADGTGFRELRDDVRRDQAIALLVSGERIDEVASRLAFANTSSFHRAFRRWTGRSPGAFLAEQRAGRAASGADGGFGY